MPGHVVLEYCMMWPNEDVRNLIGGVCNTSIPYLEDEKKPT
jgi:hypothetical protein